MQTPSTGRSAWALAMALALSAACISPQIPIGTGARQSAKQRQSRAMGKFQPATLDTTKRWKGDVRDAKLRVWADAQYQGQNVRWQRSFDEQLDDANQVLVPLLGVRLVPEYRSWDHNAPEAALADHLAALAERDPGDDVVWVIGLTSSLSLASATFEQLGIARVGDPHLVVRGYADLEERKAFERAFPDTDPRERAALHDGRRHHKLVTVLLHELAHSLGALHEAAADQIMSESYSHNARSLGDLNRELMLIVLADRLKLSAARDPRATAQQQITLLEGSGGGLVDDERAQQLERLRGQLGAQPAGGITGAVPAAATAQYERAAQLLARGDHRSARAEIDPLIAAYPAHVQIRTLACKIELARGGPRDPKAISTCERAVELSSGAEPALSIAAARQAAGDAAGARATLVTAEARLAKLAPEQAGPEWLLVAGYYRSLNAVTWTEQALAKASADAAHPLAQWAATTRVRYGVPRDGARYKLTPADEGDALAAVNSVLSLGYAKKPAEAAKAAAAAEARWPGLPGLLAARCDAELGRGALDAARALCQRAAAQNGSSWALYLLGIIELREVRPGLIAAATTAGIRQLRAAIALDPDLDKAWRALGKALTRAKATAEREQLARDYQSRFGGPLPP